MTPSPMELKRATNDVAITLVYMSGNPSKRTQNLIMSRNIINFICKLKGKEFPQVKNKSLLLLKILCHGKNKKLRQVLANEFFNGDARRLLRSCAETVCYSRNLTPSLLTHRQFMKILVEARS